MKCTKLPIFGGKGRKRKPFAPSGKRRRFYAHFREAQKKQLLALEVVHNFG